jgi:AcrR family transcriptional regulator
MRGRNSGAPAVDDAAAAVDATTVGVADPARPGRAGRPRDAARHRAVLDATVALLREGGYDAVTVSDVARRAGVGRQLVYQWWPTTGQLVREAILARDPLAPREYRGPFAADLRALVEELVAHIARPEVLAGLPGLTAEAASDPSLRSTIDRWFTEPVLARYRAVFARAVERREVRADVDAADTFTTLCGAALHHLQARPDRSIPALTDHLVDVVLHGVAPR